MTDESLKLGVVTTDKPHSVRTDRPLSLAYIGDAVWELYVRHHLLASGWIKPNDLQKQSVRFVSAKAQATVLEKLMPLLTDEEQDIVRRGRNAKSKTAPKNAAVLDYRHSTAVEALIGYLYLTDDAERLNELMQTVFDIVEAEGKKTDE